MPLSKRIQPPIEQRSIWTVRGERLHGCTSAFADELITINLLTVAAASGDRTLKTVFSSVATVGMPCGMSTRFRRIGVPAVLQYFRVIHGEFS